VVGGAASPVGRRGDASSSPLVQRELLQIHIAHAATGHCGGSRLRLVRDHCLGGDEQSGDQAEPGNASRTSLAGSILVSTTRNFGSCHSCVTSDSSCLLTWSARQENTRTRLAPRQNQRTRARVIGLISRDDVKRYRNAGADQVALLIRGGRMTRSQHLFDLLDLRLGPARRQPEA